MSQFIKNIKNTNPVSCLYEQEYAHYFLCFCSFVCLAKNKKINLANIFLNMLGDKTTRDAFKMLCDIETDYAACRRFLEYDPSLYKSKYIRNYLDGGNLLDRLDK